MDTNKIEGGRGKVALIGSDSVSTMAMALQLAKFNEVELLGLDEIEKRKDGVFEIKNYSPVELIPQFAAKTRQPKHHNRAYPKRKKKGKKTHRKY